MRWRPFRITNPWLKFLAIVLVFGLRLLAFWFIPPEFAPLAMGIFYAASGFAVLYFLTRVFRVREEPVVPPRAWWRATGRPAAGFVIAGFFLGSTIFSLVPPAPTSGGWVSLVAAYLPVVVVGAYFAHSSIRLVGRPLNSSLLPTRRSDW